MTSPLEHIPYVLRELPPSIAHMTILDCGCGVGRWGHLLRTIDEGREAFMVGVEISKNHIHSVNRYSPYDELIRCDVRCLPFRPKSFDIVLACEVIEHLQKGDGIRFLRVLETIAEKKMILTTPNAYLPQEVIGGNVFSVHRSAWTSSELKRRGFKVRGIGLRIRPSPTSKLPLLIRRLLLSLTNLLAPFSEVLPNLGWCLLFTKLLKEDEI